MVPLLLSNVEDMFDNHYQQYIKQCIETYLQYVQ